MHNIVLLVIIFFIITVLCQVTDFDVESHNVIDDIDFRLTTCYKSRIITSVCDPKFKLNAFCINLESKKQNMDFIYSEWKDYLNISRFVALSSATKSHIQILKNIYNNKENIKFPIAIIEDDVFRRNNFTKYWNELLYLKDCDYVVLDCFFLVFSDNQDNVPINFVSLKEHNMIGFNIYYKRFFDRFNTVDDLEKINNNSPDPLDMIFTHDPKFIKYTPKEQICRQVVSKQSTTASMDTHHYIKLYDDAEKKLMRFSNKL